MAMTAEQRTANVEEVARQVLSHYSKFPINRSLFSQVDYKVGGREESAWVYPKPFETSGGPVVDLESLAEQLILLEMVRDGIGVNAMHGSLKANLAAAYNPNTISYKENVLDPKWVYTGELGMKNPNGEVDVRRAVGARFVDRKVDAPAGMTIVDKEGKEYDPRTPAEKIVQVQFSVEPDPTETPLQKSFPTKFGHFDDSFDSVVPTDGDLKDSGTGHWYGTFFFGALGRKRKKNLKDSRTGYWYGTWSEDNLSAVGCDWVSGERALRVGAYSPSGELPNSALPIWTRENPKK